MAKDPFELTWQEIPLGFVHSDYMSCKDNHTGSWRSERPIVNEERCIKCGVCALYCPEACIITNENGYFHANLDYCKGCGVCVQVCWTGCIDLKPEE